MNNIVTLKSTLGVTHGHWKWHIRKLGYGFLFTFCSNYGSIFTSSAVCEIFSVREWRDLENWIRACSRSLFKVIENGAIR